MPELPEAETIVRTLVPHVAGHRIAAARFLAERARNGPIPVLSGHVVRSVRRYGKQVLLMLDTGLLAVELRMTGLLLWRGEPGAHTRAVFEFAHGTLCFDDIRQFGSIRWLEESPTNLGPDALEISAVELGQKLRRRARTLKPLLLDQCFLRGLGNIYTDEILFRSRLHPNTLSSRVGFQRANRLCTAMQQTLRQAIERGGSSISDYVDANGQKGQFQFNHLVYGRAGLPCPRCGGTIRRMLVAQRGTHYCPNCQRK